MFSQQVDQEDLRSVFNLFDEDSNGLISEEELKKMLISFGQTPSFQDIRAVVTRFDANGNGQVDFEEFVEIMKSTTSSAHVGENDNELSVAFRLIDGDDSGKISMCELRSLVARTNETLSGAELDDLLREIDLDGDGEINFQEFCELMTFTGPS